MWSSAVAGGGDDLERAWGGVACRLRESWNGSRERRGLANHPAADSRQAAAGRAAGERWPRHIEWHSAARASQLRLQECSSWWCVAATARMAEVGRRRTWRARERRMSRGTRVDGYAGVDNHQELFAEEEAHRVAGEGV